MKSTIKKAGSALCLALLLAAVVAGCDRPPADSMDPSNNNGPIPTSGGNGPGGGGGNGPGGGGSNGPGAYPGSR